MSFEVEIQSSVTYLSSDLALKTLDADAYWPKWNSPWWHMLLLHFKNSFYRTKVEFLSPENASLIVIDGSEQMNELA